MTDTEMSRFTRPRKLGERETIRSLLPYLWPRNEMELRVRVVAAIVCLFIAKIANVYVPVLYKHAIDALGTTAGTVAVLPVGMILAYGLARVLSLAFGELRDAIFAKVAQRSIRSVALNVFRHLHALSLRFHLERQTGGLSRSVERGTQGDPDASVLHAVQHPADAAGDPAGLRDPVGDVQHLVRAGDLHSRSSCISPIPWSSPSGGRSSAAR